jgi:uncharacterized protein (DUF305 family)
MPKTVHGRHYLHLLAMSVLSFIAMFVLMYAMVDEFANVFLNSNQFYMAGLMTMPMVLIELAVMRSMYANTKLNIAIAGGSILLFILFLAAIRWQFAVEDSQFLRSMIPHHGGAILMCEEAPVQRPEVKQLCSSIIENQRAEIALMKRLLAGSSE